MKLERMPKNQTINVHTDTKERAMPWRINLQDLCRGKLQVFTEKSE